MNYKVGDRIIFCQRGKTCPGTITDINPDNLFSVDLDDFCVELGLGSYWICADVDITPFNIEDYAMKVLADLCL